MAIYTLFQDAEDLHTIVSGGLGWRGAVWSNSLFACDAWSLGARRTTELERPMRAWASRMLWPESIATWCSKTGDLVIFDDYPGLFASEYLGLVFHEARWAGLEPGTFPAGLLAVASNDLTVKTGVRALGAATPDQLAALSDAQAHQLLSHKSLDIRFAAARRLSPSQGRARPAMPPPAQGQRRRAVK